MNNDLISREALKEDFKSRLAQCNEWIEKAKDKETKIRASAVKAYIAEVIMTINNAPTVKYPFYAEAYQTGYEEGQNARPQGEWIAIEPYNHKTFCPFCKKDTRDINYDNFCPNCGAKMKGGVE